MHVFAHRQEFNSPQIHVDVLRRQAIRVKTSKVDIGPINSLQWHVSSRQRMPEATDLECSALFGSGPLSSSDHGRSSNCGGAPKNHLKVVLREGCPQTTGAGERLSGIRLEPSARLTKG